MEPTYTMRCKFPGMERSSGKLGKQCRRMIERTLPHPGQGRNGGAGVAEALGDKWHGRPELFHLLVHRASCLDCRIEVLKAGGPSPLDSSHCHPLTNSSPRVNGCTQYTAAESWRALELPPRVLHCAQYQPCSQFQSRGCVSGADRGPTSKS